MKKSIHQIRETRKKRTRARIRGTAERPRLSVFRSNRFIYAQLIDDVNGRTLASVSTKEVEATGDKKVKAKAVGLLIAQKRKRKE